MCLRPLCSKLIIIFLLLILSTIAKDFKCSRNSNSSKCRLTTMTPYRFIANYDDTEINFDGCEAKKLWLLIRHGTRKPGKKILLHSQVLPSIQEAILTNCKSRQCYLTEAQRKRLTDWRSSVTMDDEMLLASEGENELTELAERYQARFPTLMPEEYTNETYKFKFTAKQRTKESARHFSIGLFGKYQSDRVWYPESEEKDPILRFYKACDKWQQDVNHNSGASAEVGRFKNSSMVRKMLEDISNRIGFEVNYDTAMLIRTTCAFETAWNAETQSPWCDLLSPYEFELLEYAHDLQYYWIDGYGHQLTYKQACPALRNMFDFFKANDGIKTVAYFTHSGTLLKVLCLLGVAKDEGPLSHSGYSTSKDRLWRTSLIDAFATNIAFVLYNCQSSGPSILAMHQERIINLPGCPKDVPCPLSIMHEQYPDKEEECTFEQMCSIDK